MRGSLGKGIVVLIFMLTLLPRPALSDSATYMGESILLDKLFLTSTKDQTCARSLFSELARATGFQTAMPTDLSDHIGFLNWLKSFRAHLSGGDSEGKLKAALAKILPGAIAYLENMLASPASTGASDQNLATIILSMSTSSGADQANWTISLKPPNTTGIHELAVIQPVISELIGPAFGLLNLATVATKIYEIHPRIGISLGLDDVDISDIDMTVVADLSKDIFSGAKALGILPCKAYQKLATEYMVLPDTEIVGRAKSFLKTLGLAYDLFFLVTDGMDLGETIYNKFSEASGMEDIVLDYRLWSKTLLLAGSVVSISTLGIATPLGVSLAVLGGTVGYLGDRIAVRQLTSYDTGHKQSLISDVLGDLLNTRTSLKKTDRASLTSLRDKMLAFNEACTAFEEKLGTDSGLLNSRPT